MKIPEKWLKFMKPIAALHPGYTIIPHTPMKFLPKRLCDRGKNYLQA
jgi:hypothetical protein